MAKMEKPLTKSQLIGDVAESCGVSKKQVGAVLDAVAASIKKSLGRGGCGKFVLPGLLKVEKKRVPARQARKGVPNPFKPGETMDVKARPAYDKIVVRALKGLKDMV